MAELQGTVTILSSVLAPAFFDVLGLAALGAPVLAVASEIQGQAQRKAFLDKFAQHVSAMGFGLLLLVLAVGGAGAALAAARFQEIMTRLHAPGSPLYAFYVALGLTLLTHGLYRCTWRLPKGAHCGLGILASLSSLAAIHVSLPGLRGFAPLLSPEGRSTNLVALLFPGPGSPLWPCLVQYAALSLTLAGALALLFLLHRRDRDNYGRDYYAFSMRRAARWAAWSLVPVLAAQPWLLVTLEPELRALVLVSSVALLWALALVVMLTCLLLWLAVARSGSPMRLKGLMIAAGGGIWVFHSLLLAVVANLFFS